MKKRIAWLDYARSIAIFSVVVIHSLEMVYKMDFADLMKIGEVSLLFRDIVFAFGRPVCLFSLRLQAFCFLIVIFQQAKKLLSSTKETFFRFGLLP